MRARSPDKAGWPDILLWILILIESCMKVTVSQRLPQSSAQIGRLRAKFQWVPAQGNTDLLSCRGMMEVENLAVTYGDMRQLW